MVLEEWRDVPTFRCPCCKCKTLRARGAFEMCPVCWWEDDGQDEEDADVVRGGPNGTLSLRAAQRNYLVLCASEVSYRTSVRAPRPDEL
jgi:hypothetical protein